MDIRIRVSDFRFAARRAQEVDQRCYSKQNTKLPRVDPGASYRGMLFCRTFSPTVICDPDGIRLELGWSIRRTYTAADHGRDWRHTWTPYDNWWRRTFFDAQVPDMVWPPCFRSYVCSQSNAGSIQADHLQISCRWRKAAWHSDDGQCTSMPHFAPSSYVDNTGFTSLFSGWGMSMYLHLIIQADWHWNESLTLFVVILISHVSSINTREVLTPLNSKSQRHSRHERDVR